MLFWRSVAVIRARADRALCKDKYVGQYIQVLNLQLIYPAMQFYELELKQIDEKESKDILREALEWDKKHPQKNSPVWFCHSGHGVYTSETYPKKEWNKRRAQFKKEYEAALDKE